MSRRSSACTIQCAHGNASICRQILSEGGLVSDAMGHAFVCGAALHHDKVVCCGVDVISFFLAQTHKVFVSARPDGPDQ